MGWLTDPPTQDSSSDGWRNILDYTQYMNTVIIRATKEISLDELRTSLAHEWSQLKARPDRLVIEESNSRVYIYHARLDSEARDPRQLFLDYSSQELVKKVILTIGDTPDYVIDNDNGTAMPGNHFVVWLRSGNSVLGR